MLAGDELENAMGGGGPASRFWSIKEKLVGVPSSQRLLEVMSLRNNARIGVHGSHQGYDGSSELHQYNVDREAASEQLKVCMPAHKSSSKRFRV